MCTFLSYIKHVSSCSRLFVCFCLGTSSNVCNVVYISNKHIKKKIASP